MLKQYFFTNVGIVQSSLENHVLKFVPQENFIENMLPMFAKLTVISEKQNSLL